MAGMFDYSDPEIALAAGLLSGRGNLGGIMGRSLMDAQRAYLATSEDKRRNKASDLQAQQMQMALEQAEQAKKQQQAIQDAARQSLMSPSTVALQNGQGPTIANLANMPKGPQFDQEGFINRLFGVDPLLALQQKQALAKQGPKFEKLSPGERGGYFEGGKWNEVAAIPEKAERPPSAVQEYEYAQQNPGFNTWDTNRRQAGAINVSYQQPISAVNPQTGKVELYRPDNKGGMTPTGIAPPPQHRDNKLPAEIQRMNIAADTMTSMLGRYEGMLDQYNPRDPMVQGNPAIRAEFQALMKGLQLQFKEVQALGALAGPDLGLMEAALTDPFTYKGAYYGAGGLRAQIKQSKLLLQERRAAIEKNTTGRAEEKKEEENVRTYNPKTGKLE
jgi:hypothetical protein